MQQYRVERLLPDGSWKNLGSIMAGSGPVYNFTDKHPVKGINQYRLAMINLDASYQYSEIRKAIIANTANDIEIVRNPDVSLEVIVYGEASEVMVYDLSGHQLIDHPVKNSNNSPGSIKISFSQYPLIKGLYFVKAIFTNGEEKVLKFMKK